MPSKLLPLLVTIPGVELAEVGVWDTLTGVFEFTTEWFQSAVDAQADPDLRTPVVKAGHVDQDGNDIPGAPAFGRIINLRLNDERTKLIGDLAGVPAKLAPIMAAAFPSRSIEADIDVETPAGHKYPFVLTGLALLGADMPAIQSLNDLIDIYYDGTDPATAEGGMPMNAEGTKVAASIAASRGVAAAAVATHHTATSKDPWDAGANIKNLPNSGDAADYKKAFAYVGDGNVDAKGTYKFPHHFVSSNGTVGAASTVACSSGIGRLNSGSADVGASKQAVYNHLAAHLKDGGVFPVPKLKAGRVAASINIDQVRQEFYENAQSGYYWIREVWSDFIIVDDGDGDLFRIPWTETADGDVQFGDPVQVQVQYVPATDNESDDTNLVLAARYSLDQRARLVCYAGEGHSHLVVSATSPQGRKEGSILDPIELRTSLGLAEDATDDDVKAKLTELVKPPEASKPELPEGVVTIDESTLDSLKVAAAKGADAAEKLRIKDRDDYLKGAIRAGKFAPARLEHFQKAFDADEAGARQIIDGLAEGLIPVNAERGHAGDGSVTAEDDLYAAIFGDEKKGANA